MGITTLLQDLTGPSPNSGEDIEIDLGHNITWLIQDPPWGSNVHWIYAANKKISGNFTSHLIDSGFDSVLKSLGTYLGMDSLAR